MDKYNGTVVGTCECGTYKAGARDFETPVSLLGSAGQPFRMDLPVWFAGVDKRGETHVAFVYGAHGATPVTAERIGRKLGPLWACNPANGIVFYDHRASVVVSRNDRATRIMVDALTIEHELPHEQAAPLHYGEGDVCGFPLMTHGVNYAPQWWNQIGNEVVFLPLEGLSQPRGEIADKTLDVCVMAVEKLWKPR